MLYPPLKLKKHESRRLKTGHLWVFSNEVDTARTPLRDFNPGDLVTVIDHENKPIGNAYINPNSLICARLLSRSANQPINQALIEDRIKQALALRQRLFPRDFYRLVYSESDLLPGLIVDRFGDALVVQISTAGMDALLNTVIETLQHVIAPRFIIINNDNSARDLEQLPRYVTSVGEDPPEFFRLEENNASFLVPAMKGQKTGWFYDHRGNRHRMQQYVNGASVLDVFSYLGGWGIQAAMASARRVECIEASSSACELLMENARINNVEDRLSTINADAFEALAQLHKEGKLYDVIVLDPPAFIKKKKDIKAGTLAYERITKFATRLLSPGGILISASCSYHLSAEQHMRILRQSTRQTRTQLQVLERGSISPDHPIHPAIAETEYLSCFFNRIIAW